MSANKLSNREILEKAKTIRDGNISLSEDSQTFIRFCPVCGKEIDYDRKEVLQKIRKGNLGCCSMTCAAKNRPETIKNSKKLFEAGRELDSTLRQIAPFVYEKERPVCKKIYVLSQNKLGTMLRKKIPCLGFCSKSCAMKYNVAFGSTMETREKNAIEKYGSLENYYKAIAELSKKGIEEKYGSYSNFMKTVQKKGAESYFKKTGYSHNMRNPECVKINQMHRVATIKNFTPEQKEHYYKARLEAHKRNDTFLFGGKRPEAINYHSKKADSFFTELARLDYFKNKECVFGEQEKMLRNEDGTRWVFLDFFVEGDNVIVEYYGDFWHANPKLYDYDDVLNQPRNGKIKASALWKKDKERLDFIRGLGYNKIITVWESDIDNKIVTPETVLEEIKRYE